MIGAIAAAAATVDYGRYILQASFEDGTKEREKEMIEKSRWVNDAAMQLMQEC